jgi:hypothetical protein
MEDGQGFSLVSAGLNNSNTLSAIAQRFFCTLDYASTSSVVWFTKGIKNNQKRNKFVHITI